MWRVWMSNESLHANYWSIGNPHDLAIFEVDFLLLEYGNNVKHNKNLNQSENDDFIRTWL